MKRLLIILAVIALGLTAACDEPVPPPETEDLALPEGTNLRELAQLVSEYEPAHEGWSVGLILSETAESEDSYDDSRWKVVTPEGDLLVVYSTYHSNAELVGLLSAGDVISWSPEGDDDTFSSNEVEVLDIGVGA